ncbi:MAG: response regulator [Patescibacteria group bacterium]|nr:response regulator [Patescibacteria group bacterium]
MSKKILIMEDEKILQNILVKKLLENNYEVKAVDDGVQGITAIEDGYDPDLILLDMLMPNIDGFQVLERLKNDEKYSLIPIIIISNSGQPVEVDRALSFGVVDYLIKSDFDPNEVLEKIKKYFDKNDSIETKIERKDVVEEEEEEEEEKEKNDVVIDNAKKIKILLVEDDDFLRDICKIKLEKEQFDVITSANGIDALKKIQEENPQLVLLDVILPGMDGFDILKNIKNNSKTSSIPIIMLTNLGQTDEVDRGISLGAEDYIIKAHFTVGEIIDKVRTVIKRKNIE